MRDSIESKCRFRRAGIEQGSIGALHLDGFESHPKIKTRYPNGYLVFMKVVTYFNTKGTYLYPFVKRYLE